MKKNDRLTSHMGYSNEKKRQEHFVDPNATSYVASQMQQINAQRAHLNAGMRNYPERPDSFGADNEHLYESSKPDRRWQRDGDGQRASSQIHSHLLNESPGGNGNRAIYQGQMLDPRQDFNKQENKEGRVQVHEQDMEIGYEDNPSPLTFEGLEQKFLNEIRKVFKEQSDAEDAENARHKEKMVEINTQYQERVISLRARQTNQREEFLQKESQTRLHQYQQDKLSHYQNPEPADHHDMYSGSTISREAAARLPYGAAASQYDMYRERPQYPLSGSGRTLSTEGRVPYPSGRVYNASNVHYPDIP